MKLNLMLTTLVICCSILLLSTPACALYMADITYDYVDNGGGDYTFELTVSNTSTGADTGVLDFFMIYLDADFDYFSYSAIGWSSDAGWYVEAYEPDASFGGLPGSVLADDSFLGSYGDGIAQDDSLDGFSFGFNYVGPLSPDEQTFFFLAQFGTFEDPILGYDYEGEYTGNLRYLPPAQPPNPVPEPSTLVLTFSGWIGMASLRRWRKASHR